MKKTIVVNNNQNLILGTSIWGAGELHNRHFRYR